MQRTFKSKNIISLVFAFLMLISIIPVELGISLKADAASGFYVDGTTIRDGDGQPFVMRGVNIAHAWFTGDTQNSIRGAAARGANVVRVVCADGDKWTKTSLNELNNIVSWCKSSKVICILEAHDTTGDDNTSSLNKAANYWIEMKSVLQGNEDYVILNIANEWFGSWDNASSWASGNQTAIQTIRNAGIKNMIMIDCAGYGQWPSSIFQKGKDVFNSDTLKNTVFSIHMYNDAGANASTVKNNIDNALAIGVPVVIGEFAAEHPDGKGKMADVDEGTIMSYCTQKNVGYLGWSWKGNSSDLASLDIANDWSGSSLTTWGNTLFNSTYGITNTSKLCSIYTGTTDSSSQSSSNNESSSHTGDSTVIAQGSGGSLTWQTDYQLNFNLSGYDSAQIVVEGSPSNLKFAVDPGWVELAETSGVSGSYTYDFTSAQMSAFSQNCVLYVQGQGYVNSVKVIGYKRTTSSNVESSSKVESSSIADSSSISESNDKTYTVYADTFDLSNWTTELKLDLTQFTSISKITVTMEDAGQLQFNYTGFYNVSAGDNEISDVNGYAGTNLPIKGNGKITKITVTGVKSGSNDSSSQLDDSSKTDESSSIDLAGAVVGNSATLEVENGTSSGSVQNSPNANMKNLASNGAYSYLGKNSLVYIPFSVAKTDDYKVTVKAASATNAINGTFGVSTSQNLNNAVVQNTISVTATNNSSWAEFTVADKVSLVAGTQYYLIVKSGSKKTEYNFSADCFNISLNSIQQGDDSSSTIDDPDTNFEIWSGNQSILWTSGAFTITDMKTKLSHFTTPQKIIIEGSRNAVADAQIQLTTNDTWTDETLLSDLNFPVEVELTPSLLESLMTNDQLHVNGNNVTITKVSIAGTNETVTQTTVSCEFIFEDMFGNVICTYQPEKQVPVGETAYFSPTVPRGFEAQGYDLVGWERLSEDGKTVVQTYVGDDVEQLTKQIEQLQFVAGSTVIFKAKYKVRNDKYTMTITNGQMYIPANEYDNNYTQQIEIGSAYSVSNYQSVKISATESTTYGRFQYWLLNGQIYSYNRELIFTVWCDADFEAVYDDDAPTVTPAAFVNPDVKTYGFETTDTTNHKITFDCAFYIPDSVNFVSCGIIFTPIEANLKDLSGVYVSGETLGGLPAKTALSSARQEQLYEEGNNQVLMSLVGMNNGVSRFARAYLIYEQNGQKNVVFSTGTAGVTTPLAK